MKRAMPRLTALSRGLGGGWGDVRGGGFSSVRFCHGNKGTMLYSSGDLVSLDCPLKVKRHKSEHIFKWQPTTAELTRARVCPSKNPALVGGRPGWLRLFRATTCGRKSAEYDRLAGLIRSHLYYWLPFVAARHQGGYPRTHSPGLSLYGSAGFSTTRALN